MVALPDLCRELEVEDRQDLHRTRRRLLSSDFRGLLSPALLLRSPTGDTYLSCSHAGTLRRLAPSNEHVDIMDTIGTMTRGEQAAPEHLGSCVGKPLKRMAR